MGGCRRRLLQGRRIQRRLPLPRFHGQSDRPSYLWARRGRGERVHRDQLPARPSDRDRADDVYAARVGGGLASRYATAATPCASTEACSSATALPAPPAEPLGSSVFSGPGDLLQTTPPPPPTKSKSKPPTQHQVLARALKRCRRRHNRARRKSCERQARKRYAPKASHHGLRGAKSATKTHSDESRQRRSR